MNGSGAAHPLSGIIAALLPGSDAENRERVAEALAGHVRQRVEESWTTLLRRCTENLPDGSAAALRTAACEAPEPDLLMSRLDGVITPGVLLSLPLADRAAIEAILLAHEEAQVREQTLDALSEPGAGCAPLGCACAAWSMRMLIAELGRVRGLSHSDRLALQDQMLAWGEELPGGLPGRLEPQTLRDALRSGTDRRAVAILAERARVKLHAAELAASLHDPKLLASLCWRAGCDPEETFAVQVQLGRIPPDQVLHPDPDGHWPLEPARLQWHIAMLEEL
jgi:hypothetical protein